MIKKILALLLLVLPLCMQAQFGTGKWVIHPRYAINAAQNVIDAGDKVYFLVSNCLYSLDKATKVITKAISIVFDVTASTTSFTAGRLSTVPSLLMMSMLESS